MQPNIFFETDQSGKALYVNDEQWHALTGGAYGSWLGDGWALPIHPDDKKRTIITWQDAVKSEEEFECEFRFVHSKSQKVSRVNVSAVPVHSANGTFKGYLGSATDITADKELSEQTKLLEQSLLQSQKMEAIGTLTAGVIHDFNNVLTTIIALVDFASLARAEEKEIDECLDQIGKAAMQGSGFTKGLLEFLRNSESSKKSLALGKFLQTNADFFNHLIPASINMEVDVCDDELIVYADASQLQQVLVNLFGNAVDAMPDGGSLSIRLVRHDDCAQIVVADTGAGIPKEIVDRIFDPFFTTKAPGVGTGLGLAIAHRIATNHNGEVCVNSLEGAGTAITISLPLLVAEKASAEATPKHLRLSDRQQ